MERATCQIVKVKLRMTISGDLKKFSVVPASVFPAKGYRTFSQCVARKWKEYHQIPAPEWRPGTQTASLSLAMGKGCGNAP